MASFSKKPHCSAQVLDVFIWEKIVRFLPVQQQQVLQDDESQAKGAGDCELVLKTVQNLRLVSRELAEHFRPTNQVFWRNMVLQCFDFTIRESDMHLEVIEDAFDRCTLEESVRLWRALDVRFRPSQFQFLTDIQSGRRAVASWPEGEDAYSLFVDLVLVSERFRQFKGEMHAQSEGEEPVDPVLLSAIPADADWDPRILHGYESSNSDDSCSVPYHPLFVHCGFLLETWEYSSLPVTHKWLGFRAQDAARGVTETVYSEESCSYERMELRDSMCSRRPCYSRRHVYPRDLPSGKRCMVKLLQELVKSRFSDWRQVTSCYRSDGAPVFYVGKSTLSSRWMGFAGHCAYRF